MCGRYKLSASGDELSEAFDLHGESPSLEPRFNIAPTQLVPVIRTPRMLEFLRWGLKLPSFKAGGFNTRVESLGAPFYRDSIVQRRCLIIADGFYEWQVLSKDGQKKQPFLIRRPGSKPFAFAGFWDRMTLKNGKVVEGCSILTTPPRGVASEVHDRMPLILPVEARTAWLDPSAHYRDLLEPDANLELVPVSTLVNSVKNDGPACAVAIPGPNSE